MILKSIQMINFRQFKNEKIEFSTDNDKKLTVILGDNTTGKTTLVKAFLWCLYQENNFGTKILLNNDVLEEMSYGQGKKETKVIVDLIHDNKNYTITTRETYYRDSYEKVRIDTKATTSIIVYNGEKGNIPITQRLVKETINDILSEELKNYFFFEGENNTIENASAKKNLKEAISKILGIEKVETLKSYFRSDGVISRFFNKKPTTNIIKENDVKMKKEESEKNIKEYENENVEINNEISNLIAQQDEAKSIIKNNEETSNLQKGLIDVERELNDNINKVDKKLSLIQDDVNSNNGLLKILLNYNFVKNNLAKNLKESTFNSNDSLSNIEEGVIDQLIKRGYCLCGAKIESENDAYKHLIEAKQHMAPHNYDKYVEDFINYEENIQTSLIVSDIRDDVDKFISLLNDIEYEQKEIKRIKQAIKDKPNVAEYQTKVDRIDGQISEKKLIEERNNVKIEEERNKILNYRKQLAEIFEKGKENEFYDLCIEYANRIYEFADRYINDEYSKTRRDLNKLVNSIFKEMYHGNREITIDDNYNVDTKLSSGKELDQSTGLSTVVNYAFVIGLIKLIKDKNQENKDSVLNNENDNIYPLVMDAPFSSTDEIHITNICKALTKYCNQVIIAVMEKDFKMATTSVSGLIGKAYKFEKISESDTKIKEVNLDV